LSGKRDDASGRASVRAYSPPERIVMPELDYALLCDYVRAEAGIAHVIAAGIDTIHRPEVPSATNLGLLARVLFTEEEGGQPHQLEVNLHDQEGQQVAQLNGTVTPQPAEGLPEGWPDAALIAVNFGVPLPSHGVYTLTILLDGTPRKSINLRVVPPPASDGPTE
jgi:Family of unknown function (DUF6941)